MGDDDDRAVFYLAAHVLEDADEVLKAPQVDAGLGLFKDAQTRLPRKQRGDLDALELAAGEGGVDLAVDVVARAETDLGEIGAGRRDRQILSRREGSDRG